MPIVNPKIKLGDLASRHAQLHKPRQKGQPSPVPSRNAEKERAARAFARLSPRARTFVVESRRTK